jgi:hypothetical protein
MTAFAPVLLATRVVGTTYRSCACADGRLGGEPGRPPFGGVDERARGPG